MAEEARDIPAQDIDGPAHIEPPLAARLGLFQGGALRPTGHSQPRHAFLRRQGAAKSSAPVAPQQSQCRRPVREPFRCATAKARAPMLRLAMSKEAKRSLGERCPMENMEARTQIRAVGPSHTDQATAGLRHVEGHGTQRLTGSEVVGESACAMPVAVSLEQTHCETLKPPCQALFLRALALSKGPRLIRS